LERRHPRLKKPAIDDLLGAWWRAKHGGELPAVFVEDEDKSDGNCLRLLCERRLTISEIRFLTEIFDACDSR
jgi:hypothetical protein